LFHLAKCADTRWDKHEKDVDPCGAAPVQPSAIQPFSHQLRCLARPAEPHAHRLVNLQGSARWPEARDEPHALRPYPGNRAHNALRGDGAAVLSGVGVGVGVPLRVSWVLLLLLLLPLGHVHRGNGE